MTESNLRIPAPEPISLRSHALENIRFFRRQWKYFCISTGLNRLPEEQKAAILLLYVGREASNYIHDYLELSSEEMTDCDRILAALEANHQPRTSVMYQRFLFHQTVQYPTESVDHFVDKLRELAEQCAFEEQLEMVRDRFIVGLQNKEIQSELLSMSELSLSKAVRICKQRELEEEGVGAGPSDINVRSSDNNVRPSGSFVRPSDRVADAQETPNNAHSTTLDVDPSSVACSVKEEKLDDDDDDLVILSHHKRDCVTSSNRVAKRIKLESSNSVDVSEICLPVVDVESDQWRQLDVGSFVVSIEDWNSFSDPPIWKIDTPTLLQKFIPIEYNGITLHKSTAVYSSWSFNVRKKYYKAPVEYRRVESNSKDTIVLFLKDRVPSENQFEKVNGNYS